MAATQPILILKEGAARTRGRTAQRNNIMAARLVGEVLRSTLGPRGMDKMLVDSLGDVTVTNDGATILKEIDVQHPAAKMMVEAAKAQDTVAGDGTTTVVVITTELLKKAEELLDQNIHPTVIVAGYKKAADKALQIMDEIAMPVDVNDRAMLTKVASTSIRSKAISSARGSITDIAIDAVKQIVEKRGDTYFADVEQVQVVKKAGESLSSTKLIKGIIIDKEVVHPAMPKKVENAKILLLDFPLEIEKTDMSAEIRIKDPRQMKAFLDEETKMLKEMVDKVKATGANVLLCQKGIDDVAQHFLAKEGIMAVRRIKGSDVQKIARATGAKVANSLEGVTSNYLGYADLVEERKFGDDKLVFIEGCKDPKSVAIFLRGGLERFVDEAERAFHDALCVVADVYERPKIVAGGGAIETEVAKRLRDYAAQVGGREQLAIEAFAESIEGIPRTLAENAGLDPIDIIVSLRAAHEKAEGLWHGVDVFKGKVVDMMEAGVVEPLKVKEQALKSAVEAASMILRIDDVITAERTKGPTASPKPPVGPAPTGLED
ncbi:MAG: thermosome subunit beta [Candidatus Bathyarchaeia archaeon]